MFVLEINTDNAAFEDPNDCRDEISRLLSSVGRGLLRGENNGTLIDNNGNAVGFWELDNK